MIFSTKTMHASIRKQTIWRPYCHSEIVMISFFCNISIIVRWISNKYDSFNKPTLFGFIPHACFFAVFISSRRWWYRLMLWFKIKSTEVHATEVSKLFQRNYEALLSLLYSHFYQSMKMPFIKQLHISQNSSTIAPLLARKFTCGP